MGIDAQWFGGLWGLVLHIQFPELEYLLLRMDTYRIPIFSYPDDYGLEYGQYTGTVVAKAFQSVPSVLELQA